MVKIRLTFQPFGVVVDRPGESVDCQRLPDTAKVDDRIDRQEGLVTVAELQLPIYSRNNSVWNDYSQSKQTTQMTEQPSQLPRYTVYSVG